MTIPETGRSTITTGPSLRPSSPRLRRPLQLSNDLSQRKTTTHNQPPAPSPAFGKVSSLYTYKYLPAYISTYIFTILYCISSFLYIYIFEPCKKREFLLLLDPLLPELCKKVLTTHRLPDWKFLKYPIIENNCVYVAAPSPLKMIN